MGPAVTHTGGHLLLAADYRFGRSTFALGPKLALTDSYLPHHLRLGGHAVWRFRLVGGPLVFFGGPEYHVLVPEGVVYSWVHEFFLAYGVEIEMTRGVWFGNAIGQGIAVETFQPDNDYRRVSLGGLFKIYIRYGI